MNADQDAEKIYIEDEVSRRKMTALSSTYH